VASATSEDGAWSTWKKMKAKHASLSAAVPVVVRADLGTKGIFYRVRLGGFEDQNAAKKSCNKLKSNGVSCYVSKINS
jgi:cell division septation protein DedD